MNSIAPQDLLDLKSRIDLWRSTRRFIRQAMPDDIRLAVASAATRHPRRLLKDLLKLDPSRFKPASSATTKPAKSLFSPQQIDFVTLSPTTTSLSPDHTLCHLQINRRDGSHLTLSLPPSNADLVKEICSTFILGGSR
jgi:hypothetical protein